MFPVAALGPRIGEQHENPAQAEGTRPGRAPRIDVRHPGCRRESREGIQEERGLGLDEEKILQVGPLCLPPCPLDPIGEKIDADAKFVRVRGGVGVEVMAVPATDLQGERSVGGEERQELVSQRGESLFTDGIEEL